MNRFRKMGFIEYNGRIRVHKSLLNVILHDETSEQNASSAPLFEPAEEVIVRSSSSCSELPEVRGICGVWTHPLYGKRAVLRPQLS
jgi:hypothetical protein